MRYYFLITTLITLFYSCSEKAPHVELICNLDRNGTYHIKWHYESHDEGDVEIYTSPYPEDFSNAQLIGKYPIDKGYIEYNNRKVTRRNYFLLKFNNKYQYKLGTHFVSFDSIQNFRDVGGYQSRDGRRIKWGKIYRSGRLDNASYYDCNKLRSLYTNTLIDIRSNMENEPRNYRKLSFMDHFISTPFSSGLKHPEEMILNGEYRIGDACLYLQDMLIGISQNSQEEIRRFFDVLLTEDSYPVIISDRHGLHQINFAMTVLYYALDIPHESIVYDAMLSNKYFDKKSVWNIVRNQNENVQCIATTLLTVQEHYINSLHIYLDKKYGSINNYLSEEIGLTDEDKCKLKDLLLEK